MNKRVGLILIAAAVAGGVIFALTDSSAPKTASASERIALCLKEKGAIMYGAAWCSHCQKQKSFFGDAFKHIPYVECPEKAAECQEKKIKGYPTWIFPDGTRLEGEQPLSQLEARAGCPAQ